MDKNKQYIENVKVFSDSLDMWKDTQSKVVAMKDRTNEVATKLYWSGIKMNNNKAVFRKEQIDSANELYDEFLGILDVYDEILKQIERIVLLLQPIVESVKRDGSILNCNADDVFKVLQEQKLCREKFHDCAVKGQELEIKAREWNESICGSSKKDKGFISWCKAASTKIKTIWKK